MTESQKEGGPGDKGTAPAPRLPRRFVILAAAATLVIFITLLALSYAYPAMNKLQNAPKPSDSTRKMERLGVCLVYYAVKHGGALPAKLSELRVQGFARDFSMFDSEELPGKVESEIGRE